MSRSLSYAKCGDAKVANKVTGAGPMDLVLVPGFFNHLEMCWEHPDVPAMAAAPVAFKCCASAPAGEASAGGAL